MGTGTTADSASISEAEQRRQRAVQSLGLVDDVPQERFDRITRLARSIFEVPMSSITILDGDRAWFPSSQGIAAKEMPRNETLCDATLEQDDTLIIEDTMLDNRFSDRIGVTRDHIRFYAGHPLRDGQGTVIGTFCLFDTVPRSLSPAQRTAFTDMAKWAEQELVASAEMSQAGEVQASMLPAHAIKQDGWEVAGICLPALAVGGDYFDYRATNDVVHLGLGDVMGKGTGAALVGAGVRSALRGTHSAVTAGVDLGVTVTQVGRSLLPDLERAESFVTLFETAIDLSDGLVRYVDAGMGLCLLLRLDGSALQLAGHDRPIGVLPEDHWTEHQTILNPGDRLLVFSDGLLDLVGEDWVAPVTGLLAEHPTVTGLLAAIEALAQAGLALDDVTAVAVYREPLTRPAR